MRSRFDSRPLILRRKYTQLLRGGEALGWKAQVSHSLHLFFVILVAVVSRNVANQQLLDALGPQVLGKLYVGVSIIVGLTLAIGSWLAREMEVRRLARGVHIIVAIAMAAAYVAPEGIPVLRLAIYVSAELCAALLLLAFGLLLNARLGPRDARMTAARVGLGGMLGGLAAGAALRFGAVAFGSRTLLLICAAAAFLPLLWLPNVTSTRRRVPLAAASRVQHRALAPYGRWVALTTLLMVAATTLIDYQYRATAAGWYAGDRLTAFFGDVTLLTGVVSIVFQVILLGRVLDRFGLFATASLMPAVLFGSVLLFGLLPLRATLVLLKVLDSGGNMSVQQATGNLLLAPLGASARAVWQGRIDGVAKRGGQAAAGLFLDRMALAPPQLAPAVLVLCAVWVLALWRTRGRYIRLLSALLGAPAAREPTLTVFDGATLRMLEQELPSAPAPRAAAVLDLLEYGGHHVPTASLLALVDTHAGGTTARRVIEHLATAGDAVSLRHLVGHRNADVAAESLAALAEVRPIEAVRACRQLLSDATCPAALRGMALGLLAGDTFGNDTDLRQILASPEPAIRLALSRGLSLAPATGGEAIGQTLCLLARDPDRDVARTALAALAVHPTSAAIDVTLKALAQPALRTTAMRTLGALGPPAIPNIAEALARTEDQPRIAAALAWSLGHIGSPSAVVGLLRALDATHVDVRLSAAIALTTLRRKLKQLRLSPDDLYRRHVDELAFYARMRDITRATLPETPAAQLLRRTAEQRGKASLECLFRLLSLRYAEDTIQNAFIALSSPDRRQRQLAMELLDTVLDASLRPAFSMAMGERPLRARQRDVETLLALAGKGGDAWMRRLTAAVASDVTRGPAAQGARMSDPVLDRVLELQAVALFQESAAEDLAELAALTRPVELPSGNTIFREGEPGDTMYVIRQGEVSLRAGARLLETLSDGDAFGIVSVLDRRPREMTAVATTRVRLWSIEAEDLFQLLADRPLFMHSIFRAITDTLRSQVDRIALGRRRA